MSKGAFIILGLGGGWQELGGHHIFQQWDGGSSKIIVEVRGVSLFFVQKAV